MLKALRIASIFTVIAAAAVIVFVALFGLKENTEIETFLQREGIVDQFRKKIQNIPQRSDAVSPLESAAKAFALRIDPPPPPPPPTKKSAPAPPPVVKPPVASQTPKPPENKKPVLSAKFTLEATARYPEQPEKSLALLKTVQNEYKWYRQGEPVGHLEVQEIRDGSVVLYQDGKFNSELFMPAPPKTKSLLKSENAGMAMNEPQGPVAVTLPEESDSSAQEAADEAASPTSAGPASRRTIPSRLQANREDRPTPSTPLRTTPPRPAVPAAAKTPEEQKKSIDESISSIEQIMARTPDQGQSEEEIRQEQEAWQQLIQVLHDEKMLIEQTAEEAPAESAEPAPSEPAESTEPEPEQEKPESESKSSDKIQ